jgi:phospholipase/lecithinase/hemolysin
LGSLSSRAGLAGRTSNYVIGGARLDPGSGPTSLPAQIGRYLRGHQPTLRILYIVFGGGNDLLAAIEAPGAEGIVDSAAAALAGIAAELAEHGARDILVPNLPDVGRTPEIRNRGETAREHARRLTDRFNAEADGALAKVASRFDVRIYGLDVRAMAERARADPAASGFADVAKPCMALRSCDGHLFWDHVHPTTRAHARLAEAAADMLLKR